MDINSLDSFRVSTKSSGVNWNSAFCHFHVKYLFGCVAADILSCSWTTLYCKLNLLSSGDIVSAIWYLSPLATWSLSRWRDLLQRKYLNTCMLKLSKRSNVKTQRNLTDGFSGFCLEILDNFLEFGYYKVSKSNPSFCFNNCIFVPLLIGFFYWLVAVWMRKLYSDHVQRLFWNNTPIFRIFEVCFFNFSL